MFRVSQTGPDIKCHDVWCHNERPVQSVTERSGGQQVLISIVKTSFPFHNVTAGALKAPAGTEYLYSEFIRYQRASPGPRRFLLLNVAYIGTSTVGTDGAAWLSAGRSNSLSMVHSATLAVRTSK
jgi:hypothetical protein